MATNVERGHWIMFGFSLLGTELPFPAGGVGGIAEDSLRYPQGHGQLDKAWVLQSSVGFPWKYAKEICQRPAACIRFGLSQA